MALDNINGNITTELPKWKLKEDESFVADEAITAAQVIEPVTDGAGKAHAIVSTTPGAKSYIAVRDAAVNELVAFRQIGVCPANVSNAVLAGQLVQSAGDGGVEPHVAAGTNWAIGRAIAPMQAGGRIGIEIEISQS